MRPPTLAGDSRRLSFLVRAGEILAGSPDGEVALAELAGFAVPGFCDLCVAYAVDDDGVPRLCAAAGSASEQGLREQGGVAPQGSFALRALEGNLLFQPRIDAEVLRRLDPSYAEMLARMGVLSAIAVPLAAHGHVLGALSFSQSVSGRRFQSEDAVLAGELGKRAGLALWSSRLLRREQDVRRRLELLSAASGAVADNAHAAAAMASEVVRLLADRLGDGCALRLLGKDGLRLEPVAQHHRDPEATELSARLLAAHQQTREEGLAARVFASGEPVQLGPMEDEEATARALPWFAPFVRRFGCSCILYVPMRARGRVHGILALTRGRGRPIYTAQDREAAQQIADRMASALESLRLYEAEQEARRRSEQAYAQTRRMHRLATSLSSAADPRQIARVSVEEGVRALEARAGVLAVLDPAAPELRILAFSGYPEGAGTRWERFPLSADVPLAEAARTGRPVFVESLETFERTYPASDLRAIGDQALLAVPLRVEGRTLGALGMTFAQPRAFGEGERAVALALAAQCAQALERARLYEAEQRSRARYGFIAQAASILSSSLDSSATLANVARLLVPELADWCLVEIFEEGKPRQVAVAHVDPAKVELARTLRERYPPRPEDPGSIYQVMETGAPQLYPEISDELLARVARGDPEHLRILRELGLRSALVVPLSGRGRVLGTLTLVTTRERERYGPTDLWFAQELCRHVAAAVENAQLFREAREAVNLRDAFLSVAGHELRTPLTALKLQLQLFERLSRVEQAPGGAAEVGVKALRQADRLERLIRDLLDVSRIAAGKLSLDREDVDLAALAREVGERFADDLARAGCSLRFSTCGPVQGAWDRGRLDQVLTNLLGNAIKYGKGAPIELGIARKDGEALLWVRDHGIGIAPEHQARIFGRFERAVSERQYGGLGLGLWIARQVVDAHGGSIRCQSAPGEGSTFTVLLPLAGQRPAERA